MRFEIKVFSPTVDLKDIYHFVYLVSNTAL